MERAKQELDEAVNIREEELERYLDLLSSSSNHEERFDVGIKPPQQRPSSQILAEYGVTRSIGDDDDVVHDEEQEKKKEQEEKRFYESPRDLREDSLLPPPAPYPRATSVIEGSLPQQQRHRQEDDDQQWRFDNLPNNQHKGNWGKVFSTLRRKPSNSTTLPTPT